MRLRISGFLKAYGVPHSGDLKQRIPYTIEAFLQVPIPAKSDVTGRQRMRGQTLTSEP